MEAKNKKYYINSAIGLAIMFFFGLLPNFGPLTDIGMRYIGVFIGLIFLWNTTEIMWPCIVAMAFLILTKSATMTTFIASGFGNSMGIYIIFVCVLFFAISETGIFNYFTNWILKLKFVVGRPWMMTYSIFLGVLFLSAIGADLPILFIFWSVCYDIASKAGLDKDKNMWVSYMIIGIIFAFVIPGQLMPYKSGWIMQQGTMLALFGEAFPSVSFAAVSILTIVVGFVAVTLYTVIGKFILRIDLTALRDADVTVLAPELPPLSGKQKFAIAYLFVFLGVMLLNGFASYLGGFGAILSAFGTAGIAMTLLAPMLFVRFDGVPFLDVAKAASTLPWSLLFMFSILWGFIPSLTAPGTGVTELLQMLLNPIASKCSGLVFLILIFTAAIVLTQFLNNGAVLTVCLVLITAYVPVYNYNLVSIAILSTIMANVAFLLPGSSFYGAIIYTQEDNFSKKHIMTSTWITVITMIIVMVTIIIPMCNIMFG